MECVRLIGVDCAAQRNHVGLAYLELGSNGLKVLDVDRASASVDPLERVVHWIKTSDRGVLGLDAPLGWPAALGQVLKHHEAGMRLGPDSDTLFRRATDRDIYLRLRKTPLDVGASFLARTANAALELLGEARVWTGCGIPMGWEPGPPSEWVAIEVYPAATIRGRSLPVVPYKKTSDREGRRELVSALEGTIDLSGFEDTLIGSADALDAVLCGYAAATFVNQDVCSPMDMDVARKEGWIWA